MRHLANGDDVQAGFSVGDDEGRLVAHLRRLKGQRSSRRARAAEAMTILEKTGSPRVRNAAALALADLRADGASDALIALLARPDTRGSRGTLLYALDQLGAKVPLRVLGEIIVDESYEAREEALAFIEHDRVEYSAEELARVKLRLQTVGKSADAERLQAIRRALERLG